MFQKISPRKISDEIIEQFKALLNSGEIKPGDELPSERELAQLIGVSRPPLREALNALHAMGFVEIRPRRKVIVKSLVEKSLEDPLLALIASDINKLFELLEIRRAMESWAAYKAAQRATPADLEKLEAILLQDQENLKKHREDAKTDADLHVAISLASHNTLFSHLMASCYRLLWDTQRMSRERIFQKEENRKLIAEQHQKVIKAIEERDPEKAGREARKHIDFVEQEMRKIISEDHSEADSQ